MYKRLQQLETNVAELAKLRDTFSVADIKSETVNEWALRYGLLESIQIMIDISCHLVVHNNLGNAQTYAECIELLHRFDYIDRDLEEKLKGMAGLRNILVHEYVAIDIGQLLICSIILMISILLLRLSRDTYHHKKAPVGSRRETAAGNRRTLRIWLIYPFAGI